jgi:hypothetical protein
MKPSLEIVGAFIFKISKMNIDNIGEIGKQFSLLKKINYISQNTFLDYEGLILNFQNGILNPWHANWKSKFEKRKEDLIEFIKHKDIPIVVFISDPIGINRFDDGTLGNATFYIPGGKFSVEAEIG